MKTYFNRYVAHTGLLMVLAAVALGGCAFGSPAGGSKHHSDGTGRMVTDLTPAIETLYLHWHDLDRKHKDIKFLERGLLAEPDDRQLGYVQKVSLYIQDASLRIHHQWERLSVLGYIRAEVMRDYLTLNLKSLTWAIDEIRYDTQFMEIYAAFVDNPAIVAEIEKAQEIIAENVAVMIRIREKLRPVANPAASPTL